MRAVPAVTILGDRIRTDHQRLRAQISRIDRCRCKGRGRRRRSVCFINFKRGMLRRRNRRLPNVLLRALYIAVQCGLRKRVNERLKAFYEKKRKEGKPYKVVVIACANKLLHHVYAILLKSEPNNS